MTQSTPPTPESEMVARLRARAVACWTNGAYVISEADRLMILEAAATIERLHSAHEQGRREGIEMAVTKLAEMLKNNRSGGFAILEAIRALSSAPPGEKGERIPSGWKLVPVAALEWLFGAQADDQGRWFDPGQFPEAKGAYWWRKVFRDMLAASPPPAKAEDGMQEVDDAMVERAVIAIRRQIMTLEEIPDDGIEDHIDERERTIARAALRAALAKEGTP